MATTPQQDKDQQPGNRSGTDQGSQQRSEGLLPGGKTDDGRFEIAEEVNADQQSDKLRRTGQLPESKAADDELPDPGQQSDG